MKQPYNVLIIEDHLAIVDGFKNALSSIEDNLKTVCFSVNIANDCEIAYNKIKNATTNKPIDFIFLDISLPPAMDFNILSGQDLGVKIRALMPNTKILVCTGYTDNLRLNSILKAINPEVFLIKCDVGAKEFIRSIEKLISNQTYYSQTVIDLLMKKASVNVVLDDIDIKILHEISNGARMKELVQLIPLSKSGIEKRKRKLREIFNINNDSNRELVLVARGKGFI
ncbi:DNA-binding response regulator [Yeosuana sp.]|uniref:DNA-binding response regulator n=1 Tax=Yeosuana sp. TaxID=2529388 RepID=UPI004055305B